MSTPHLALVRRELGEKLRNENGAGTAAKFILAKAKKNS